MRGKTAATAATDVIQLRLLLEELCCDLCRFEHTKRDGIAPDAVQVDRERHLGAEGAYADIRVAMPGRPAYFVEVKFGYSDETLVHHLARKYGSTPGSEGASSVILVVDLEGRPNWQATQARVQSALRPGLRLEVWSEEHLLARIRECFEVTVDEFSAEHLMDARNAIDHAKARHAFSDEGEDYEHSPLTAQLLWHFGFWRLRRLRERFGWDPRQILAPGHYRNVVVLIADLCAFSSYMRDSPDVAVARDCLTAFYSRARYQIINNGGMLYQFVGDEVIGLFGLPDESEDSASIAYGTARALLSIGMSVANKWQRQLDRVQPAAGLHIGMAAGDLQIVSLRPFSRTHVGALGDCINLAARLMGQAGPGEIAVTNGVYNRLGDSDREGFAGTDPCALHNVGNIQAWKSAGALLR
jgi:class 3 adenylate cyclase